VSFLQCCCLFLFYSIQKKKDELKKERDKDKDKDEREYSGNEDDKRQRQRQGFVVVKRRILVHLLIFLNSFYIAYFCVHCRAVALYFSLSVLYVRAISGTNGSSGFGSQSNEQMESNTFEMVNAGDH